MVGAVESKFFVNCFRLEEAINTLPLVSDLPRDEWGAPSWEILADNEWRNDSLYRLWVHLPKTNEECREKHGMSRIEWADEKLAEAVALFQQRETPLFSLDQHSITNAGLMYLAAHDILPDEAESDGVYVEVSW